mmetsp:Transcript_10040/g.20067  ORF Transcript_10040/g.20067 Transcript_10040/m.20067 type:complete len:280 (+) Transcript_10040:2765-3604(+)
MAHQVLLPCPVSRVHAFELRKRDVAFVYDEEPPVPSEGPAQIVHEGVRSVALLPPGQVARVVFHALTKPSLSNHFQVVPGPLLQTCGGGGVVGGVQGVELVLELCLDALTSGVQLLFGCDVVPSGVDADVIDRFSYPAPLYAVKATVDEGETHRLVLVRGPNNNVRASKCVGDSEGASLLLTEAPLRRDVQNLLEGLRHALNTRTVPNAQHHACIEVVGWKAQPVDARHGGNDDDVTTFEHRPCGAMPQCIELLIDGGGFGDVRITGRKKCLRLVEVVI